MRRLRRGLWRVVACWRINLRGGGNKAGVREHLEVPTWLARDEPSSFERHPVFGVPRLDLTGRANSRANNGGRGTAIVSGIVILLGSGGSLTLTSQNGTRWRWRVRYRVGNHKLLRFGSGNRVWGGWNI